MKRREIVLWVLRGCCIILIPGLLFYRSVPVAFCLLIFLPVYLRRQWKEYKREAGRRLNRGFADALLAFSAALEAGYSAENAIVRAEKDLAMIYPEDEPVRKEFRYLERQLQNNQSLEQAFADMAERTQDKDIQCFAQVFEIAKRSGGDLVGVIKAAERTMAERADVKREIQTLISAKRLEAGIMKLMPCGILLYFLVTDPEYLSPLYEGVAGRCVMTVLLGIYVACVLWIEKLTEIEI